MEESKKLLKTINRIFPINDFLYILQLEEYKTFRYIKQLKKFFFRRNLQKRDTLKHTKHILLIEITALSILLLTQTAATYFSIIQDSILPILIITPLNLLLTPIHVLIANILTLPIYFITNRLKVQKAKQIIRNLDPQPKIIGITGSFGKTTTKNFTNKLIKYNYKTQATPGTINTELGIAKWIRNQLKPGTEILIIEMSAYTQTEIKACCKIAPPDIAVITALADQHLERFGSFKNLVNAKKEIFDYSKPGSIKFITKEYSEHLPEVEYKVNEISTNKSLIYKEKTIKTSLKSDTAKKSLQIALKIAEQFDIPYEFIQDTCQKLTLPDRRKQIIERQDFQVIDDSYNISFETATNGIKEALEKANKQNNKLVLITAGIPELGKLSEQKNTEYGKFIGKKLKNIILLQSDYASYIEKGTNQINSKPMIIKANSMKEAWKKIPKYFDPKKHIVLMQPELTDLSY